MAINRQETREEKLRRQISNLTRALDQEPTLRSLRKRRAELERKLEQMPAAERMALVPKEETERERQELIAIYAELISDCEKELAEKRQQQRQDIQKIKDRIKELRQHRARLLRERHDKNRASALGTGGFGLPGRHVKCLNPLPMGTDEK